MGDPGRAGRLVIVTSRPRPGDIMRGPRHVAENLVRHRGSGMTPVPCDPLGGEPAVLGFVGPQLVGMLVLTVRDGMIHEIQVLRFAPNS